LLFALFVVTHARPDAGLEHLAADEDAAARAALQVALGDQLLVGQYHGVARHLELLRQGPARRQLVPRRQGAGEDAVDQLLPNLVLQIQRAVGVEVDEGVGQSCIRNAVPPAPRGRKR
jgi:hypothetical protein